MLILWRSEITIWLFKGACGVVGVSTCWCWLSMCRFSCWCFQSPSPETSGTKNSPKNTHYHKYTEVAPGAHCWTAYSKHQKQWRKADGKKQEAPCFEPNNRQPNVGKAIDRILYTYMLKLCIKMQFSCCFFRFFVCVRFKYASFIQRFVCSLSLYAF